MNLKLLHESFIEKANRPMQFGKLPVEPKEAEVPVVAVDRWRKLDRALNKTYTFRRDGDRERFVSTLLEYEATVQHHACITIMGEKVSLRLSTHDIDDVTELDREYAAFADASFKDVVYSRNDEYVIDQDEGVL